GAYPDAAQRALPVVGRLAPRARGDGQATARGEPRGGDGRAPFLLADQSPNSLPPPPSRMSRAARRSLSRPSASALNSVNVIRGWSTHQRLSSSLAYFLARSRGPENSEIGSIPAATPSR